MIKLQRRRAISTIIATGIMLSAVAVLGSALVAWSNGNLKIFEISLANTSSNMTNQINENLLIEHIQFCNGNCPPPLFSSPGMNVTLTNTGFEGLTVTKIQVNGNTYTQISPPLPASLMPHKSNTFGFVFVWTSKSAYTITVTTSRGTIVTTQVVAP